MIGAVVFLSALVAGVIQTVTGFGSGIMMMLFFPAFFPVLNASALASSISLMVSGGVAWKYRKYIRMKLTIVPAVVYIVCSSVAITLGVGLPTGVLKKIFGTFLILLSIYFFFAGQKKSVKASLPLTVCCAALSGVLSGLFGIGGPPMVIYFLSVSSEKEDYLGTLQLFFTLTNFYVLLFRIYSGIYTLELLGYTMFGIIAIFVGMQIGYRIVDKMDKEKMKKCIYLFLGLSGFLNILA